jgi:hypothetical protein
MRTENRTLEAVTSGVLSGTRAPCPKNNEQEADGLPSTRRGFRDDGAAQVIYRALSFLSRGGRLWHE